MIRSRYSYLLVSASMSLLAASAALVGCDSSPTPSQVQQIPAALVGSCSSHTSAAACGADTQNACSWASLGVACPAGSSCPTGVCSAADPCAQINSQAACTAEAGCGWSSLGILCPVGDDCSSGGFCHAIGVSGGGCACAQPIACPPNAACPAVACDCPPPPAVDGGSGSGGGTCTCACPACAPGQACPPCSCDCGGGGGGGGCSSGGGSGGGGTCACACPVCAPGETCPPCDCNCADTGAVTVVKGSAGGTTTSTTTVPASGTGSAGSGSGTGTGGGMSVDAGSAPPSDPCSAYADAQSCTGDAADSCAWIALGIPCSSTGPCKSGVCQKMTGGSGSGSTGCGCACPACVSGQSCPPCSCTCCSPPTTPLPGGPTPVPQPASNDAGGPNQ
jgi:hypothetical protein